jgi:hypothetical protein
LAPGVSDVPHATHSAPASGAPQFEQNFPDAGDWHAGQTVGVVGLLVVEVEAGLVMREL